jgi:glycosyltransferase involved in cell wall biosynthesis
MRNAASSDTIGVVVPTLNCASFLADTLSSIRRVPHIGQVVIADSGSTDGTLDIARAANVEVFSDAPPGLYRALNAGFSRLTTRWVTYINGDDLLQPSGMERLFSLRDGHDVLYGPVDFITGEGVFIHCWHSAPPRDLLPLFRSGVSPLLQQGTLFRRDLFDGLGGFCERWQFVADADFWWRAAESGARFHRSTHPPVASFRMHSAQLSQVYKRRMADEHREMVRSHGCHPSRLRSCWAISRYRAAHWQNYLARALRQRDLSGSCRPKGSYDF